MSGQVFMVGRKPPRVFSSLIFLVGAMIGFALYWAQITVLPEIVRSSGQIAPLGQLHFVGHYDGGVVDTIEVRPGDRVSRGDVLAVVRKPDIEADMTRVRQQIVAKQQDEARLRTMTAFLRQDDNTLPGAMELGMDWTRDWSSALQYQIAQIETYLSKKQALEARATRALAILDAAHQVRDTVDDRIKDIEVREARAIELYDRGLTTLIQVENETDTLDAVRSEAMRAGMRVIEAENSYSEALDDIVDARTQIVTELNEELYRVRVDLAKLHTELALYEESMARANVVANADGTVQTVEFTATGEIVPAGGTIASILPADDQLVAKVRLAPSDIGHIKASTPVRLGLTTFDVRRYGHIEGRVQTISPTSDVNDREEPSYEVVVVMEKDYVESEGERRSLRSGMEVSAEFMSEERTVLEYFAGPLERALAAAFTER